MFAIMGITVPIDGTNNIRTVKKYEVLLISVDVFTMALWFIDSLAEEASKSMSTLTPEEYTKLVDQYEEATSEIIYFINLAFNEYGRVNLSSEYSTCSGTAIKALSNTASFCFNYCSHKDTVIDGIRKTLSSAIDWCRELQEVDPLDELVDMLDSSPRVFGVEQCRKILDLIKSPWATEQLSEVLRSGEVGDDKVMPLLTTFGIEKMKELLEDLRSNENYVSAQFILSMLTVC
jgi:hypothetical protein